MKNFTFISTHLINLTKKEIPFEWTEKFEESFQNLKTLDYRIYPSISIEGKDFIVYCYGSHSGLGILLIQDNNVITYMSHQLKVHERSYPSHDLELAAILLPLKIWRNYLYGVQCEAFIDHHNLQHVFTQKYLNLRQQRLMELLKDYVATIQYHSIKANVVAGTLIREMVSMGILYY